MFGEIRVGLAARSIILLARRKPPLHRILGGGADACTSGN